MRISILCLLPALAAAIPLMAQQSASYKITEQSINNGGDPQGGTPPASLNFKVSMDAIGYDVAGGPLSSASFIVIPGGIPGVNNLPAAVDDAYSTPRNTTLTVPGPGVLSNDADSDTDPISAVQATTPLHGSLTLNADGSFTYIPNTDYAGEDSFQYQASDGQGNSNPATAVITITAGCPVITLDDTLPDGVTGTAYSGSVTASNGAAPYTYTVTAGSGALPTGLTLSSSGVLSGTPSASGTFDFSVTATDTSGCSADHAYTVVIDESCLFCDDFEDGDLTTPLWTPKKGTWTVVNGAASATTAAKTDLTSPDYGSCSVCSYGATMQASGGGRVSMYAWYANGSNSVEVRLMQDKQKLLIKQKAAGLSAKAKAIIEILPNTPYDVEVTYDGAVFHVLVEGVEVATMTGVGTPSGIMKLRVKSGTGLPVTGAFEAVSVR